jgi:choline dehydrogenase-like flavoprotein/site-specific recombinase XerD
MEPVPGVRGQVEDFLAWCQGRGLSPKTWRDAYGYPLRAVLLPFCERQGIADLTDLDRRAIDRLAAELYQREPPLSRASVKSYLKSVNQLMAWWEQESGERQARAQLPRLKKKPREVLSRAELDDLEAAAPNERDKLIIRIMGDVGAREGEVANLRVGDLVARERTYFLRLRGKTGERMAPISPALYRRLKHYGGKGRPRVATSDRLFLSLRRQGDDYPYLTPGGGIPGSAGCSPVGSIRASGVPSPVKAQRHHPPGQPGHAACRRVRDRGLLARRGHGGLLSPDRRAALARVHASTRGSVRGRLGGADAFDAVVVGAGSAGCAIAGRLARTTDLMVALLEAGPDYGPFKIGRWPTDLLDPGHAPDSHDWGYVRRTRSGDERPYSRARVVGGCSAHNYCAAVWPFAEDYDAWSEVGLAGWSSVELRSLMEAVEREVRPRRQVEAALGSWQRHFMEAALTCGYSQLADLGSPVPSAGIMPFPVNVRHAVRWNSAFAFLDPARDMPNLKVIADTVVDRVVMDGWRATAVLCRRQGREVTLETDRVVVAAGAFGSPLLLMRSGIGPTAHLEAVGIEVKVPLGGVGENLHDHHGARVLYQPDGGGLRAVERNLECGQSGESQVVLRERSLNADLPDLHILPAALQPGDGPIAVLVENMAPRSRGRITLAGPELSDPPYIDFGFLSDEGERDIEVVLEGIRKVRKLRGLGREIAPAGQGDEWSYVRDNAASYGHAVGTCRMGADPDGGAVVDGNGLIHGTSNVWIADASIIPVIPRANTNLTCYLIGLRAAEVLAGRKPARPNGTISGGPGLPSAP